MGYHTNMVMGYRTKCGNRYHTKWATDLEILVPFVSKFCVKFCSFSCISESTLEVIDILLELLLDR